jgi:pimeloyl-ACP methyl ester carboxylesterase
VRNARETALRCYEHGNNAALLPHASSRNVARDMDLIRAALGERKLSYYGLSYGADLGATYTQMFPGHADRVVIDSVTDPTLTQYENFQAAGEAQERGLDEWAAWTARHSNEYRLGGTPRQVRTVVEHLGSRVDNGPLAIGDYPVDASVLGLILRQLFSSEENNATLAKAVRNLVDAAHGQDVQPIPELRMWLELFNKPNPALDNQFNSGNAIFCGDGGLTPIPCADRAVNAYLRTGTLPAADITCAHPRETR